MFYNNWSYNIIQNPQKHPILGNQIVFEKMLSFASEFSSKINKNK